MCGFFFEAGGDRTACACALGCVPVCVYMCEHMGREVCKTESISMSVSSCGSQTVRVLRVSIPWVPESLCIVCGRFRT